MNKKKTCVIQIKSINSLLFCFLKKGFLFFKPSRTRSIDRSLLTQKKNTEHNELKKQIQRDLDNLAVIDRNNTIVFPLELAGRTYKTDERDQYFEEILQKRLERRHKVNKLRESVLQHNLDDITENVKTILAHDKQEEEAFTSQFQ